jgi:hypothetical protein
MAQNSIAKRVIGITTGRSQLSRLLWLMFEARLNAASTMLSNQRGARLVPVKRLGASLQILTSVICAKLLALLDSEGIGWMSRQQEQNEDHKPHLDISTSQSQFCARGGLHPRDRLIARLSLV